MSTVRLPGSGGGCDLACLAKRVLIIMAHEPRRFVDKVRYITSPGYGDGNWRQEIGLPGGGPSAVITTLGILRFDELTKEMSLHSVHPGVSVAEVLADRLGAAHCRHAPRNTRTKYRRTTPVTAI